MGRESEDYDSVVIFLKENCFSSEEDLNKKENS